MGGDGAIIDTGIRLMLAATRLIENKFTYFLTVFWNTNAQY